MLMLGWSLILTAFLIQSMYGVLVERMFSAVAKLALFLHNAAIYSSLTTLKKEKPSLLRNIGNKLQVNTASYSRRLLCLNEDAEY
jgi:hypothetical protein